MTSKWSIIFLIAIAMVAATLHSSTAQTTHVVGDALGWTIPSGGAVVYATWASQQTFIQGDILVFNFATGTHTVAEVSKTSYDACNITQSPISIATNGPASITLNSTGEHFYICTIPTHCGAGMQLAINVSAAANTTTAPSPPPTPSISPAPAPSPSRTPASPTSNSTANPPPTGGSVLPPSPPSGGSALPPSPSPASKVVVAAAMPITLLLSIAFTLLN